MEPETKNPQTGSDIKDPQMGSDTKDPEAAASISGRETADENTPSDPGYIVDWENDDDPENPRNWPNGRKWGIISILSLMCFLT